MNIAKAVIRTYVGEEKFTSTNDILVSLKGLFKVSLKRITPAS